MYRSQSNDIIYFNYIVQTYTLYQNNNNNIVINAIQDLNKLLIDTPKVSSQFCIIHNQIGMYYFELNDHTNAIIHFKKVLTVKKDIPDVYNNIAVCHKLLKEYDKSIINLNISLQLQSNDNIYRRLGELYLITKQYDKSMKYYQSIINPSHQDIYNLSFTYLVKKQFLHGYKLYENRLLFNNICSQTNKIMRVELPSIQYWNGTDECQHLIIIYEQGIGDNIQYFRFIIQLSNNYPQLLITYFCKSNISHLFNTQ